jgi:Domain of unknown function (DUF4153)
MKTLQLGTAVSAWSDNFRRFPLASIVAHVGVLCAAYLIFVQRYYQIGDETQRQIATVLVTCMVIFPLCILAEYPSRAGGRSARQKWYLTVLIAALVVGYLTYTRYHSTSDWLPMTVMLLGAATHLIFAFLPFFGQSENRNIWEFNRQMLANLIAACGFSFVLWGGVGAAILAIDKLFELNIDGETYGVWSVLSWGLMSTGYFMRHFPNDLDFERDEMQFHQIYITLTKYILLPIALLYFFILYAYGLKILGQWQLPHGWVSSLCIGFSVAGIIAWLLNYLLPEYHGGWLHTQFKRWFWPMTFPIIALLGVGIGRRLLDYGITEDRYVVAMIAICFFVNALYFTFRAKEKQRLWFLPASVAFACLVTAIGPFEARRVSLRNQARTAEKLLMENEIIKDGILNRLSFGKSVDQKLIQKLEYIGDRDSMALVDLLKLQPDDLTKIRAENNGTLYTWGMVNYLKLIPTDNSVQQGYYSFSNAFHQNSYSIADATYKLPFPVYMDYQDNNPSRGFRLLYGSDFSQYFLKRDAEMLDTFSTAPILDLVNAYVVRTHPQIYGTDSIPPMQLQGRRYKLLLMPIELSARRDSTQKLAIESINADFYLIE